MIVDTMSDAAHLLGISKGYFSKVARKPGFPRRSDGRYDTDAISAFLDRTTDPARRRRPVSRQPKNQRQPATGFICILDDFIDRLEHWHEIYVENGHCERTFEEATRGDTTPDMLLRQLRSGLPYVEEGDWKTGEGFVLRTAWMLDWQLMQTVLTAFYGRLEDRKTLGIEA